MKVSVVVGGQFGSEGKGAVVSYLARNLKPTDLNIRVAGPNAGHTVYDEHGRAWKLRQIPAGAVVSNCRLGIAAGSEVDLEVLASELWELGRAGYPIGARLAIHPAATVLEPQDIETEKQNRLSEQIGSTGKGIGAARARRIMRQAKTVGQATDLLCDVLDRYRVKVRPRVAAPIHADTPGSQLIIEGTQGYGLGLHTVYYPKVTSSDCRAIDFLAMAGISPWAADVEKIEVWVVARVYPIRVAGDSGPLIHETTWEALGLPPERTTVTNKIRRVGQWDSTLVRQAVAANGGYPAVRIALTMLDQKFPEVAGATNWAQIAKHPFAVRFIRKVESECGAPVRLVGTSPTTMVPVPARTTYLRG